MKDQLRMLGHVLPVMMIAAATTISSPRASAAEPQIPSKPDDTLSASYPVPGDAIFVAVNGMDSNPGTAAASMRSINKALLRVKSGGTVVARGGIYREGADGYATGGTRYVSNLKNVTLQGYLGERAWMDGTEVVSSWQRETDGTYMAGWSTPSLCAGDYYRTHYLNQEKNGPCSHPDAIGGAAFLGDPMMFFVDGAELKEAASRDQLPPDSFFYDWSTRKLHLG